MLPGLFDRKLLEGEDDLILGNFREEFFEMIYASKSKGKHCLFEESADLIFHLFVLLSDKGLRLDQVKTELTRRHQQIP